MKEQINHWLRDHRLPELMDNNWETAAFLLAVLGVACLLVALFIMIGIWVEDNY